LSNHAPLRDFVDRVYIINLPEQTTRLASTKAELHHLGFDPDGDQIRTPFAPRPETTHGFPSRGVYGNFLSHLSILTDIRDSSLERALVLEDDAIFRHSFRRADTQSQLIDGLNAQDWGMWFGGHSLTSELNGASKGLVATTAGFRWAHCYIVNKSAVGDLVAYLEETAETPSGDARGGKMYIDGAFSLFRRIFDNHTCLVSNPAVSIQKGTQSNLASTSWYDRGKLVQSSANQLRAARDEIWRWSGFRAGN